MVKKRISKHTGQPRRPGEHINKPKSKVRKRLLKNNEILTRLRAENQKECY